MAEPGKYIYCIIACPESRTFDGLAIGQRERDGLIYTVCHNGLAAVVSDSAQKQYESTRHNMMAHQKALETVMREFTLLPVRFGTVTDSASPTQSIQKLLSSRGEEFQRHLKDIEGKVELGLKAFWRDEKAIFDEILAENSTIRRLRNSLADKPPQAIRFDGISLGQMVQEALGRKRTQEAASILSPLRTITPRIRESQASVDRMVVNAAFLVDKGQEQAFDQAIKQLDEKLGNRIVFKYVGPVPPYNFVNIVVNWDEL